MNAVAACPDALEAFAGLAGEAVDLQRQLARRVERAVEAIGAKSLPPGVIEAGEVAPSLRALAAAIEELVGEVAQTARAFRAADGVLAAIAGAFALDWARRGSLGLDRRSARLDGSIEARAGWFDDVNRAVRLGPVDVRGHGAVLAGATASLGGHVAAGRQGVSASAGASVFGGVEAKGDVSARVGPVRGEARGSVRAGIGAALSAGGSFGFDRIGARLDLGLTYGLGWQGGVALSVSPREVVSAVGDGVELVGDGLGAAGRGLKSAGKGLGKLFS